MQNSTWANTIEQRKKKIYTMITWVYSSMQAWFSSPKSSDITQISIVGWLDKQNVVHPYSGILLSLQRKAVLQYAAARTLSVDIRPITDGHTVWFHVHESQSRRQKAQRWLLTSGRGEEESYQQDRVSDSHRVAARPRGSCAAGRMDLTPPH